MGVPVPETTRGWQLQPLAADFPVVAKLLEYRSVAKVFNEFRRKYFGIYQTRNRKNSRRLPPNRCADGTFFAAPNPNLQQIPHDNAYRRCFRAPDGRKLIIADFSQVELRILAHVSGDQNFIDAFESGEDFHTTTAAQIFRVAPEEVTSEQRSFAKRLNFGVVYGIGSQRFALMTGVTQGEAEDVMRRYFATYPKLDNWLREAGKQAVLGKSSRTSSGRLMRYRFDEDDRAKAASARRNGKNMPIQGSSADILKIALHLLHEKIKDTSAKLVNIVHDEIIVEADANEAEKIAKLLEDAMCAAGEVYVQKVPVKVDVHISDEWNK